MESILIWFRQIMGQMDSISGGRITNAFYRRIPYEQIGTNGQLQQAYTNAQWDYGAIVEYMCCFMLILTLIICGYKLLRKLMK